MSIEIKVPPVGESITEVVLSSWKKADGDFVEMDEIIAELESDKATFELTAEKAGILKISAKEGDTLEIGATVCSIEEGAAPATKAPTAAPVAEKASPTATEVKSATYAAGAPSPAAAKILAEKGLDTTLSFMKKPFEMFDTGLNEEVLSVWKQFLSLLYMSEPYEVRAMSQEAYSKRLRMSFEEFKTTKYWQYCKGMINFDDNDYYEYILELIEDLPQEEQNTLLETLHTYFIAYYEFSKKTGYNNPLNKKIMNTKNILDIMKYFQPTINKMGEKLRRNFIRLYSLNPE